MNETPRKTPPSAGRGATAALVLLLVAVTLALGWILVPVYGPILWAVVIALLFMPLFRWVLPRLAHRRTPAALLTLLVALLVVVLPVAIVMASLANEAAGAYRRIQSGELNVALALRSAFMALPEEVVALLRRLGLDDFDQLQRRLTAGMAQGAEFIAARAFNVGQDTFEFVVGLFITLYLAFFFLRDGEARARSIGRAIPLAKAHQMELIDKFAAVIRAVVKGNLLVAVVQGALGGLAFWFLDIGAAVLGGVVMAVLSLLPAVGAALVWVPVALYLLLTGEVGQAAALCAWGALVIGSVDNVVRPVLVGRQTRIPDYLVMISTLGGIAAFGVNGFVIGPAITAIFLAAWHIAALVRRA